MKAPAARIVLFTFLAALSFCIYPGQAAIFNIADGDIAGLKSAITTSNTNGENDTINLAAGGVYVLDAVDNTSIGDNAIPVVRSDSGHSLIVSGNLATISRRIVPQPPDFRILEIAPGANATFRNLTLDGGDPGQSVSIFGAALFNDHGNVMFDSCVLRFHWANAGGAIYNDGSGGTASVTLSACELYENRAGTGGAIQSDGTSGNASVTLTQSYIHTNVVTQIGGGINSIETNLSITGGSIDYNGALDWGGGISHTGSQSGATLSAVGLGMFGNHVSGFGGGIYHSGSQLTLTGCVLEENYAGELGVKDSAQGGGLFHAAGNGTVSNCTFRRNWNVQLNDFPIQGGAIYNAATLSVSNTTFSLNRVAGDGGGIYNAAGASLIVAASTFSNNIAAQYGGGLYSDGIVTGTNCTFTGNSGLRGRPHFAFFRWCRDDDFAQLHHHQQHGHRRRRLAGFRRRRCFCRRQQPTIFRCQQHHCRQQLN